MSGDDEIRNGGFDDEPEGDQAFVALDPEEMLAGEETGPRTPAGAPPGDEDLSLDELGAEPPPPSLAQAELRGLDVAGAPPGEFVADAGTADIGIPDEEAADELVADDADAAEWAALDGRSTGNGTYPAADEPDWEDVEARLERLERIQREVVRTAREREAARLRRKVVASTTGAGAAGFIPILLQLVNALSLSPEVAATVSSAVAALGALVAGYLTPDRPPVLPPVPGTVDASPLDVAPIAPLPARAQRRRAARHRPAHHA
jgi:hypothetical protein